MRDYGKVHSSFWSSQTTSSMSDDSRLLALYLMTSSHTTIAGVFRLPDGYVCEDMKWTSERVGKGFAELFEKGFANRCETTKWVWIRKHLDWNPPENPNQRKAVAKCITAVPDECEWKQQFIESLAPEIANGLETLGEPFVNQKQKQEQKQKKKNKDTAPAGAPDRFTEFWAAFPKRVARKDAERAWSKIDSAEHEAVFAGLRRAVTSKDWVKDEGKFIPHPATWLNGRRWDDECPADRPAAPVLPLEDYDPLEAASRRQFGEAH